MKTISWQQLKHHFTYCDSTCFVYDNGTQIQYSDGEFFEDTLSSFLIADEIRLYNISEVPDIKQIMQDNYLPLFKSAEGYEEIAKMFTENKAQIAMCYDEELHTTIYMLIWE